MRISEYSDEPGLPRLVLALALALAPFLAMAYYHAAKVLMSGSDAARFLEQGGSIPTDKLDIYHGTLIGASLFGVVLSGFLALELSRLLQRKQAV
jgi:hypothetical protein